MLSLGKTKEREELKSWLQGKDGLLSWKLDGLTVVLTYAGGKLQKAVTRGNGEVGEVVTNNAKTFQNLPVTIPFKGELVIRGEAVISYRDFEYINAQIDDLDAKYKNPRNHDLVREALRLCSREDLIGFGPHALVPPERSADGSRSCAPRREAAGVRRDRNTNRNAAGGRNRSSGYVGKNSRRSSEQHNTGSRKGAPGRRK